MVVSGQSLIPLVVNKDFQFHKRDTQVIRTNKRKGIIILVADMLIKVLNLQRKEISPT